MKYFYSMTFFILMAASNSSFAALIVNSGMLMGATDINVEGTLYNVEFKDGSCSGLFSGCDEASDFTFSTQSSAQSASIALERQVYRMSEFIGVPALTNGCYDDYACNIITVYSTNVVITSSATYGYGSYYNMLPGPLYDKFGDKLLNIDMESISDEVYAVWTVADTPSAVPVPGAAWLLGSALVGLTAIKRKK
ncbi:VPLPA-CTERM sorting domain-containing protein [Oceanicoccus sagamiensis]|uniref:PEP-CTERM protein-sorting domain-containing protein n=1 Tax=Oceanicoccus sagamiensis TaxID=716816 RepID=A0A1X9NKW1_9GAMM|nr:VPLPA-CTERM sorting domain-containing protein [Oceanicoccus sagamiensis]ARN75477.1 hypothetical protein BST96_15985 [Oceanicoccus sagamiensis]